MPMQVAVAVSGGGSNLQALIDKLIPPAPAAIALVLSNKAAAGGLDRAKRHGIPVAVLADPADGAEWLTLLQRHQIDLLVLAGFLKRVPDAVIDAYRGRIVNVHPALLPAFGGAGMYGRRVHQAVLASGATESGATVHLVDEIFDHGEILAQQTVPVLPEDTPETLAARVLEVEHRLLPAVVLAAANAGRVIQLTPNVPNVPHVPSPC